MISKNELKNYSSLLRKKFRDIENKFLVEGKKILLEGLRSNFKCEIIFVTHHFADSETDFMKEIEEFRIRIEILKNSELEKLTDTQCPQGVTAVFCKPLGKPRETAEVSSPLVICLENISDPGNMGTILRNCDWFGVNEVIMDKTCADIYNPKTIRSSMGSLFHVKFYDNADLYETIPLLKKRNYEVLCADLYGENIFEIESKKKSIIIFANEANGPSSQALSLTDRKITIPKFGNAESLNVASASAVILAQFKR